MWKDWETSNIFIFQQFVLTPLSVAPCKMRYRDWTKWFLEVLCTHGLWLHTPMTTRWHNCDKTWQRIRSLSSGGLMKVNIEKKKGCKLNWFKGILRADHPERQTSIWCTVWQFSNVLLMVIVVPWMYIKLLVLGVPGGLSQTWFWLRSWSWGQAPLCSNCSQVLFPTRHQHFGGTCLKYGPTKSNSGGEPSTLYNISGWLICSSLRTTHLCL